MSHLALLHIALVQVSV